MLSDSIAMKVTIAVIGEVGSGKSAAISKGLKAYSAYRLVEPVTITDCPDHDALLQCTYVDLPIDSYI